MLKKIAVSLIFFWIPFFIVLIGKWEEIVKKESKKAVLLRGLMGAALVICLTATVVVWFA